MKYCPKCGAKEIDVYVERVLPENNGINMNKAICYCGWSGVACDLVNEPPVVAAPVVEETVCEAPHDEETDPAKMTKAALIEYLNAFHVEYSANAKKEELVALYIAEEAKHVAPPVEEPVPDADPAPVVASEEADKEE